MSIEKRLNMTNELATCEHSYPVDEKGGVYIPALEPYGDNVVLIESQALGILTGSPVSENCLYACLKSETEERGNSLVEKCPKGQFHFPPIIITSERRKLERSLFGKIVDFNRYKHGRRKIPKILYQSIGMPTSVKVKEVYEGIKILKMCYERGI